MPKEISNLHKLPLVWKLPRWPSQHCLCRKWRMSMTGKLTSFILLNGKMWRVWGQSNMGTSHQRQRDRKTPVRSTGKSIKGKKPGVEFSSLSWLDLHYTCICPLWALQVRSLSNSYSSMRTLWHPVAPKFDSLHQNNHGGPTGPQVKGRMCVLDFRLNCSFKSLNDKSSVWTIPTFSA